DLAGPDRRRVVEHRNVGAVNPTVEEALERLSRGRFHRALEVVGARLPELLIAVEAAQAVEEHFVADEPAKHVQDRGALVVDDGAEDAPLPLDQAETIAEIDR